MNQLLAKVACLAGAATVSAALASGPAFAQQTPASQQTQRESARRSNAPYNDEQFVRTAAESSMSQVDLGKLAEQKATNPEIRKFAQLMVEEHSKIAEQLKQMGMSEGVNLPTSVSRQDANTHRQLATSSGAAFEKSYARQVMAELERQITEFKRGGATATKPSLKDFAERTLPTLESELQQAKQVIGRAATTR